MISAQEMLRQALGHCSSDDKRWIVKASDLVKICFGLHAPELRVRNVQASFFSSHYNPTLPLWYVLRR